MVVLVQADSYTGLYACQRGCHYSLDPLQMDYPRSAPRPSGCSPVGSIYLMPALLSASPQRIRISLFCSSLFQWRPAVPLYFIHYWFLQSHLRQAGIRFTWVHASILWLRTQHSVPVTFIYSFSFSVATHRLGGLCFSPESF